MFSYVLANQHLITYLMNKNGPVVVIEDDEDDKQLLSEIFTNLKYKNKIVFFTNGDDALEFLNRTEVLPFLILSDVNMPRINGFELREKVHTNALLSIKCIPYLFFTTAASKQSVIDAYSLSVQGFFVKPNTYSELEHNIKLIMEYWSVCIAPNEYGA